MRLRAPPNTATTGRGFVLLLLLRMHRVFAEARAVLFELQLFAAHFPTQRVVVIAGLFTDEVDGFDFPFTFACSHGRVESWGFSVEGSVLVPRLQICRGGLCLGTHYRDA